MTRQRQGSEKPFVLLGATVLTGGRELPKQAVLVDSGRVVSLGPRAERAARKHGARRVDLEGMYLAPGFVDLHTHGAAGVDFVEAGPGEFAKAMRHYISRGVTSILTSLYPSKPRQAILTLERIAGYLDAGLGHGVGAGIHLEGPYLNPRRPGALPSGAFRRFDAAGLDRLLEAGRGWVKTMTIAPEMPRGRDLVRQLARRGVVAAFGHSDAGYEETQRAIHAGVRYATHLFNAMRGVHHREPGAVTALLEDPRIAVELIADGFHVSVPVLRLVHALKPADKVILVSDSVHPCGLKSGLYRFAGRTVRAAQGRITLLDGTLAGSLLSLDKAVALQVKEVGLSPAQSVLRATENPARAVGLERSRGAIGPGRRADLVALDRSLRVRRTWVAGEEPLRGLA